MAEQVGGFQEVVDVLSRATRVPGISSFFRALKDSPTPFDATMERNGRGWKRIEFILRGKRGVSLQVIRPKTTEFRDRIRTLMASASKGRPPRARCQVMDHLDGTRMLYQLKIHNWVSNDDDWQFIFMLGLFLCEHGRALFHNPREGFVQPGRGSLLKP